MTALWIKVILVPLLVTAVSLTARRFGPRIGGFLATIPIVAGPLILVITLEQGASFAKHAALGALQGLLSVIAFSLAYALSSRRCSWWQSMFISWMAFGICTSISAVTPLEPLSALILLLLTLMSSSLILRELVTTEAAATQSPLLLVPRVTASLFLVLTVSGLSALLGPKVSGLLAPFPIVGTILCTFIHRHEGFLAVRRLLVGYVEGIYGYAAFFFLVELFVENHPIWITFSIALIACLIGQALALYVGNKISRPSRQDLGSTTLWFTDDKHWGREQ